MGFRQPWDSARWSWRGLGSPGTVEGGTGWVFGFRNSGEG